MFRPSVYINPRPILKPDDLDNHPLAREYIEYHNLVKYPCDFQTWLMRRANKLEAERAEHRMRVKAMTADPYCRSPVKSRRHT